MWTNVVDLSEFYQDRLGHTARRMIRRQLRTLWPDVRGMSMLGLGFATPYLSAFQGEAARTLAVMPAQQGVIRWPRDEANLACVADECELPFEDLSIDRLLIVHAAEYSEQLSAMMREAWRVLSASGRLIVVVPNRRGIWARLERTPFGHGRPYTNGQLRRMLQESLFTPLETARALYIPPVHRRFLLGSAGAFERIGARMFQTFAGVIMVEASKQIYAATPTATAVRRRTLIALPGGAASARSMHRDDDKK